MLTNEHATSGSARRQPRTMAGQGLRYNLIHEALVLHDDLERTTGGRAAITLAKSGTLRVTLMRLRAGVTVAPEAVAGEASVQILEGRVRFELAGEDLDVGPGDLVVLSENLHEPVRALQDSVLLITVAWQEGAGAWTEEQRQGHL